MFSYNLKMIVPKWLTLRDAEEILPQDEVLRSKDGRLTIDANRFRWALLQKLGGWWIDPDVVLMKPDMPDSEVFYGNLDAFGQVPTGVLKFPVGHKLLDEALVRSRLQSNAQPTTDRAGSEILTALASEHAFDLTSDSEKSLGPISWFNVLDLFDPAKAVAMAERTGPERFLHLKNDVWRRAGIHSGLASPEGSFLDALFARYDIGFKFPARMSFYQLNRWVSHMYRSVQIDRGSV